MSARPKDRRARKLPPHHGSTDSAETTLQTFYESAAPQRPKSHDTAIRQFRRFLGREPLLSDLQSDSLAALFDSQSESGVKPQTVNRTLDAFSKIAQAAFRDGLIRRLPKLPHRREREPLRPWLQDDLNKILASARTMPGDVVGIPARRWWPALVYSLIDTAASVAEMLTAPTTAYEHRQGTLCVGAFRFRPHALTAEALEAIRRYDRERLLPWELDNGRPPFHMLYREFKPLLYRAGLAYSAADLFDRLRITGRIDPHVLDGVDPEKGIPPKNGRPYLPRDRDIRAAKKTGLRSPVLFRPTDWR